MTKNINFIKWSAVVFLAHILSLSFLWVGFPVPLPRPTAVFVYSGPASMEETLQSYQRAPVPADIRIEEGENLFSAPWSQDRDMEKPKI
jgi:hypothetical protein